MRTQILAYLVSRSKVKGYTLPEILIVVFIVGILAAIAAPAWSQFVERQEMIAYKDRILAEIKEAKSTAELKKSMYNWLSDFAETDSEYENALAQYLAILKKYFPQEYSELKLEEDSLVKAKKKSSTIKLDGCYYRNTIFTVTQNGLGQFASTNLPPHAVLKLSLVPCSDSSGKIMMPTAK